MTASVKKVLREHARRDRALRDTQESWLHIQSSAEIQSASVIASYISYDNEPETQDLNLALLASGKTLLLPRMLADKDLEWVAWNGDPGQLKKNGKILEPVGQAFSNEAAIDVVIVPTLLADRSGTRLGQGGGSYDRALARLAALHATAQSGKKPWKLGLIAAGELTSTPLPREPHDQKLDAVATPSLITRFYHER